MHRENDKSKTVDNNEPPPRDQKSPSAVAVAHNISINVTAAESPGGVRRRVHLRSLSDVTPASAAPAQRPRSQSERPRPSPAPSPARRLAAPAPRQAHSARCSPAVSRERLATAAPAPATAAAAAAPPAADPWRKMSDLDLRGPCASPANPWVKNLSLCGGEPPASGDERPRDRDRGAPRDDVARPADDDGERRRDGTARRGKLERRAAVLCESCGNESCECWRPGAAGAAGAASAASAAGGPGRRGAGAGRARCTCEPPRSPRPAPHAPHAAPRPSPARLVPHKPVRALSDDETRPRRLYKSASQKMLSVSTENDNVKKAADPLLETTC